MPKLKQHRFRGAPRRFQELGRKTDRLLSEIVEESVHVRSREIRICIFVEDIFNDFELILFCIFARPVLAVSLARVLIHLWNIFRQSRFVEACNASRSEHDFYDFASSCFQVNLYILVAFLASFFMHILKNLKKQFITES